MEIELPFGRRSLRVDTGHRATTVLSATVPAAPPPIEQLLEDALSEIVLGSTTKLTLIVSDATRNEPREAFLDAIRARTSARITVAIATGTHGPCRLDALGLDLSDVDVVNHDGVSNLVDLGVTSRGTPVRVHRCVVETDVVIATGCIRPHYFAGFGAGAKAIFPGLGAATAIRINHRLKTDPHARAGIVDGNPCRDDLEEAVDRVPTAKYLVNGVCDPAEQIQAVVCGDLRTAFRAGVAIARPWFTVRAMPARMVIASDALPVSASLYQAAKIAAAAAPLVAEGGTLVIAAECADGIGPLDVVNEAIFRIGVLPRLAPGAQILLVSSLSKSEIERTLVQYAPSVESVLAASDEACLVLPHASHVIAEAQ